MARDYADWISIHAPREGSDVAGIEVRYLADGISIHAPREGSDPGTGTGCRRVCHFYPRSPRGERLLPGVVGRGGLEISIHAPREGSDLSSGSRA